MPPRTSPLPRIAVIFLASLISASLISVGQVHADKPDWAGKKDKSYDQHDGERGEGKHKKDKQKKKDKSAKHGGYDDDRGAYREIRDYPGVYFTDRKSVV